MKLIDRYMSAVAQVLPESRRDEITRELRANILDKLESIRAERGCDLTDAEISEVLKHLGHPEQVAASFLPPKQLVTPELFPLYKQVLNYGIIFMFVLELIKFGVVFLSSGHIAIAGLLSGFVIHSLLMFASVTGVFYVLSNPPGGKPFFKPYQCWSPEKLPPISYNWQRMSMCERGVDFSTDLFLFLLLHYPLLMSDEVLATLTIGFSHDMQHWMAWLATVVGASLLFGLWNLRFGYWTLPKLLISATINLVMGALLVAISRLPQVVVDTVTTEERVFFIGVVNGVISTGMLWVGIWLIGQAGWEMYRAWQLSRANSN
jgi:hypothetical protein